MEYLKRYFTRYNKPISLFVAVLSVGIVFYKPLKLIYYDSTKPEFLNNPKRLEMLQNTEKRKELIIKKYNEYKECKDPDEKKRIYAELSAIHENRLKQFHRRANEHEQL
ncbi:hypothetical protein BpHYR1_032612 [Brachionus plicatilis]|uniref:Uncharacterized protein n=1 Tax=Brachionus plicatilis TaxID=10195 RepID=A0A3M7R8M3_BRAPC|nr:hypothetical protein BpHYR1_032612 [Brachionus plicatilis]